MITLYHRDTSSWEDIFICHYVNGSWFCICKWTHQSRIILVQCIPIKQIWTNLPLKYLLYSSLFLSCHTHLNGSYNLICSRSFVKTSFHIFFCNPINFPSFQTKVRPATLHCHSRTKILLKSSEPAKIFILHYS